MASFNYTIKSSFVELDENLFQPNSLHHQTIDIYKSLIRILNGTINSYTEVDIGMAPRLTTAMEIPLDIQLTLCCFTAPEVQSYISLHQEHKVFNVKNITYIYLTIIKNLVIITNKFVK